MRKIYRIIMVCVLMMVFLAACERKNTDIISAETSSLQEIEAQATSAMEMKNDEFECEMMSETEPLETAILDIEKKQSGNETDEIIENVDKRTSEENSGVVSEEMVEEMQSESESGTVSRSSNGDDNTNDQEM